MPSFLTVVIALSSLVVAVAAMVKVVVPFWRGLRRAAKRVGGALDNIGGRDPYIDPATGKKHEAIPAIGTRFTAIETKLDALADTKNRLDTIDVRIAAHELRLDDHDTTLGLIVGSTYERGAKAELKAVEKTLKNAIDVDEP